MPAMEVTIVMPCLNESETLGICVRKALAAIAATGRAGEVVIADNGSTDGSQEIARREGARVVDVKARGYGAALMGGIQAAQGKYVLMGDADDSYEFGHLSRYLEALDAGNNLVMGNRFRGGIQPGAMPPLHRYLGNPVLSLIGRVFFRVPARDFHCGLRAFRRDSILGLRLQTTGMEFASEMVVKAALMGLRIAEVPTTLKPDGRSRAPHLRTWRDGWRHLRFLLLYSPRWLFLYPGIAATFVGLATMLWLLPGARFVGHLRLDVDTLVYAVGLMLMGVHISIFAVCAKVFGIGEGLLPPDKNFDRWFRYITLETGVLAGAAMLLGGLGSAAYAFALWLRVGLGVLDAEHMLRITLPSAVLLLLGVEAIFASFFLSLMGTARQQATPPDPSD